MHAPARLLAAAACGLALTAAPASAGVPAVGPGKPAFWSGPAGGAACGTRCWEWDLRVGGTGARLRVGIDHARLGDVWDVVVLDPSGRERAAFSPGTGLYSMEEAVPRPAAGTWRVRVRTGAEPRDPRFRLRAGLEGARRPPRKPRDLLPNLQALPPWDLTFKLPLTNGSQDVEATGLDLPGGRAGCHPEEIALDRAMRCLRMAFGVANVGAGSMDLFHTAPAAGDGQLFQRIHRSDGSSSERPAGEAAYHHSHAHHHHAEAVELALLRVAGEGRAGLVPAGVARRKGFAHRDELLRDWRRFYPIGPKEGFGLKAGWGDYYEWDRPGNFVDFGLNGDGRYVVRMTADPGGWIAESNEQDNVAWSLIDVTGTQLTVLGSGRGTDPWDPCAVPLPVGPEPETALGPPARAPGCPPDG